MIDLPKDNSSRIVEQALSFRRPDRTPVYDLFWPEFVDKWRKRRQVQPETDIEDYYWLDLKVITPQEEFFPTNIGPIGFENDRQLYNDGWGRIVSRKPDASFSETIKTFISTPGDLDNIEFDPPTLNMRYADLLPEISHHRRKGRAIFLKIGGPFRRSTFIRGEENFLMDLAADPLFARALAKKVGSHLMQVGLESLRRTMPGNVGILIVDDMCNARTPMFSPALFEDIFLPIYEQIISELKKAGARWVCFHCDGNVEPLLDLLIQAGVDGINPVEPNAGMHVAKLIEKYWGRLFFIGGICNIKVLPGGDKDQIQGHVQNIIDAGRNGGLVVGMHSVGTDISLESYETYRRIVVERGS